MLASVHRRVQLILPRSLAFSTLPPRQENVQKPTQQSFEGMNDLAEMLHRLPVSPIIPEMNHSNQSMCLSWPLFKFSHLLFLGWNSFKPNRVCYRLPWLCLQNLSLGSQVINPADLNYQTRTYEPRRSKKSSVALSSSTCRYRDPFYQLDLNPRDFTANPLVLSEYLSEMGKIQGRAQTYLTSKNQRLLAKTIRRAKMMGIIPHLSILTSVERTSRLRRR